MFQAEAPVVMCSLYETKVLIVHQFWYQLTQILIGVKWSKNNSSQGRLRFCGLQNWTLNKLAEHLQVVQHSSYNYQLFDILPGVALHHCQGGDGVRESLWESLDVGVGGWSLITMQTIQSGPNWGKNWGRREHQRSVYLRSDNGQSRRKDIGRAEKMYLTFVDWEAETRSGPEQYALHT